MKNETTPMTLSPEAQAVLDAANSASSYGPDDCLNDARQIAVAALRAVAERNEYKPNISDEMEVMFSEGWNSHRKELLAIADELETL
jgi:hypothetical protein